MAAVSSCMGEASRTGSGSGRFSGRFHHARMGKKFPGQVQWDETSPRPYSRLNLIQGTKGTLAGFPTRAAFENGFKDLIKDHHSWIEGEKLEMLYQVYDHPLYKRLNNKTKKSSCSRSR